MHRFLIAIFALAAFALPAAANASPDDDYTPNDTEFLAAVGQWGFSGGWQRTVATGHAVCDLLDQGATEPTTDRFIISAFGSDGPRQNLSYSASMFTLYAAQHYCPEHFSAVSGF